MSQEKNKNTLLDSAIKGFSESGSGLKRASGDLGKGNIVSGLIGGTGSAIEGLMSIPLAGAGLVVEVLSLSAGLVAKAGNRIISATADNVDEQGKTGANYVSTAAVVPFTPEPPYFSPPDSIDKSHTAVGKNSATEEQYLNYKEMKEIARSSGFKNVSELVNKLGVTYVELDGKNSTTAGDLFVVNPSLAKLQQNQDKKR